MQVKNTSFGEEERMSSGTFSIITASNSLSSSFCTSVIKMKISELFDAIDVIDVSTMCLACLILCSPMPLNTSGNFV